MIAIRIRPAVLDHPHARQIQLPQLPWPFDPEEAGPLPALERSPALDQLALAHHPEHSLAVDRDAQLAPDEGADHAVAVGLVGERLGDDRSLDRVRRPTPLRHAPGCAVR